MYALALFACTGSAPDPDEEEQDATLVGTWGVDALEFEGIGMDEIAGEGWSGEVEIRATGVGSLDVEGPDESLSMPLETDEEGDGEWHMGGTNQGLYILDLSCTVVAGLADCVDSGEIDWSNEDSDTHVTLLSLSAD